MGLKSGLQYTVATVKMDGNKKNCIEGNLAKARKELETFFFTDMPPLFSSTAALRANSKYGGEGDAKHGGDSRADTSSWTTESNKGSPEVGNTPTTRAFERHRRNSHQDSPKLVSRGRFCQSQDDSALPTFLLLINLHETNQTAPKKGSSSGKRPRRREKTRSCPLPVVRCEHWSYEEDDAEHLQQHYDKRTWDMYIRITQAREKQQQLSNNGVHILIDAEQQAFGTYDGTCQCLTDVPAVVFDASHCLYYPECKENDCEMIFGDLD